MLLSSRTWLANQVRRVARFSVVALLVFVARDARAQEPIPGWMPGNSVYQRRAFHQIFKGEGPARVWEIHDSFLAGGFSQVAAERWLEGYTHIRRPRPSAFHPEPAVIAAQREPSLQQAFALAQAQLLDRQEKSYYLLIFLLGFGARQTLNVAQLAWSPGAPIGLPHHAGDLEALVPEAAGLAMADRVIYWGVLAVNAPFALWHLAQFGHGAWRWWKAPRDAKNLISLEKVLDLRRRFHVPGTPTREGLAIQREAEQMLSEAVGHRVQLGLRGSHSGLSLNENGTPRVPRFGQWPKDMDLETAKSIEKIPYLPPEDLEGMPEEFLQLYRLKAQMGFGNLPSDIDLAYQGDIPATALDRARRALWERHRVFVEFGTRW
jgi:hypothetical protein